MLQDERREDRDGSRGGEALPKGTRLGDYEIGAELGAGGFGVTYLAHDLALHRRVAVKEYFPLQWGARRTDGGVGPRAVGQAAEYAWGLRRFLEEARMLAQPRLRHPNLVQVHRVIEANGTAYLVTEFVDGRSLKETLDAEGPWREDRVRRLLHGLLDGVAAVHAAGLVHRDIKPANVMLRAPDETPVLIDFGAARYATGERSGTLTDMLSPGYAPFEQYYKSGRQGAWTDIYALGAVAYHALSGRKPDEAPARKDDDRLRPVRAVAKQPVREEFGAAVDAALSVRSSDRPQNVEAWRELLQRRPGEADPSSEPPAVPSGRRWWARWYATAAGALLVTGLMLALAVDRRGGVAPRDGEVFRDCPSCPELVAIPAGEFLMGSPAGEEGRFDNEGVTRRVGGLQFEVGVQRFALGRREVTRAQYAAFASATGHGGERCRVLNDSGALEWSDRASWRSPGFPQTDEHPAVCVSWEDAQAYVRWLSRQAGRRYRLPSEAEWEYATRAGTVTSRYWGDEVSEQCGHANGADAAANRRFEGLTEAVPCNDGAVFTAPVGTFAENGFGLFDLLGNVWEWAGADCYDGSPTACERRVLRGGSWLADPRFLRAAVRIGRDADYRSDSVGFRVAMTLD